MIMTRYKVFAAAAAVFFISVFSLWLFFDKPYRVTGFNKQPAQFKPVLVIELLPGCVFNPLALNRNHLRFHL